MKRYLAEKIARAIMSAGDGPTPCKRIQFKGGKYPNAELNQGGFFEDALVKEIRKVLVKDGIDV